MKRLLLLLALVALPALGQTKFSLQNQTSPRPNGATGDTWYASSATQVARLGIGTDNYCYVVNPATHLPSWLPCVSGAGASGRVAFWTGGYELGSNASFEWNTGSNTLSLHGVDTGVTLTAAGTLSTTGTSEQVQFALANNYATTTNLKYQWTFSPMNSGALEIGGGDSTATKLTLTTAGNLVVGAPTFSTALSVQGTSAGIGGGTSLVTLEDSTAMAANVGAGIALRGKYKGDGSAAGFGGLKANKSNATEANLDTYLALWTRKHSGGFTERMRLDPTGVVVQSMASTAAASLFHVATDTTAVGITTLSQASADADSHDLVLQKSRGTTASSTVITTGDELGTIQFKGGDAAGTYAAGAFIKAISAGTIGSTRIPTTLSFWVGPDVAPSTPVEKLTIRYDGNVGISQGAPPALLSVGGATTALNGQIQWSTGAAAIPLTVPGVMFVATADATTVANNASTLFGAGVGTLTIPVSGLVAGRTIRIRMGGYVSTADGGAGTKTLVFKLGGVTVATGTSAATFTTVLNQEWMAEAEFTCRTAGAGGTVFGGARWMTQVASSSAMTGVFAASNATAAANTTGTLAIDLTFNNGHATGAIKTTWATVEVLN